MVDYLKSKIIPHMHDLGIEFSANGILTGTVAIYETYTGAAGRQHVYTVIPATLVRSVQSLVGVDKVNDGCRPIKASIYYPRDFTIQTWSYL